MSQSKSRFLIFLEEKETLALPAHIPTKQPFTEGGLWELLWGPHCRLPLTTVLTSFLFPASSAEVLSSFEIEETKQSYHLAFYQKLQQVAE